MTIPEFPNGVTLQYGRKITWPDGAVECEPQASRREAELAVRNYNHNSDHGGTATVVARILGAWGPIDSPDHAPRDANSQA